MRTKVKESPQVQQARQKLKNQLEEEEKYFNPKSLKKMGKAIERSLHRHDSERIHLKDKEIHHLAGIKSKAIIKLFKEINKHLHPQKKSSTPLSSKFKKI